ncbi:putative NAD(P)H-dependent D-xylose reductase xyl1 [Mytilinidion resinicola]|uniref:NAD(P)H-dependent D-xylose reductase xyl1 n=1 Tax=Mytilinidion resinicola TaxID=574789 RepID=A0A6A6YND6_9PEZI|nr:putative NAD(P)H-dependent D-xylose reductase xyl1 [Mytilinidion resinicola]KAF2810093.1 putative NAD(P)H-dependent D-xylose reductase xyl1 [Mytilinidion resinicola]
MSSSTVKLNSGHEMPLVGLGLWKVDGAVAPDLVYEAIKTGYRCFDGAAIYGNEKEVGRGFARAFKDGLVTRADLFIVSKLWCTFHDPAHVGPILKRQLADLQLDYLDLYYIHFPFAMAYVDPAVRYPSAWSDEFAPGTATLEATWHAMEDVVAQGLVRSIGVSNYNGQTLSDLFNYAKIRPAVLQIEHHPYLTQEPLVKFARSNGVQITAYSSFGSLSFLELDNPRAKNAVPLTEQEVIKKVAAAHEKTPAQVLLRWSTQRGVAVIPKSSNKTRLEQNLDVTGFTLSEEEIEAISGLDKGLRFNDPLDDGVAIPVFA